MIGLVAAILLADALGCPLDEGSVHPCPILGVDLGTMLQDGFVLGWLMFVTWPGMLASLAGWAWLIIRHWRRRARRSRR